MKLRRSPVWLAFIVMPVIPALMGTFTYLENLELLHSEWYSLWTQHTLFTDYIFLPLLIGIYCSYTMYIEQKNHNWNRVLTAPVPKGTVFAAKLVCVGFLILLSELWIAVLYVVSGKLVGLSAAVPLGELTVWCLFGTLGGIVMAAMQLTLSLFLRGFAMPVAAAPRGRPVRAALSRKAHGAYLAVFAHGLRHELQCAAGADEERLCRFYNYLRSIFMRFHGDRFYDPLPLRQLKMQHEA